MTDHIQSYMNVQVFDDRQGLRSTMCYGPLDVLIRGTLEIRTGDSYVVIAFTKEADGEVVPMPVGITDGWHAIVDICAGEAERYLHDLLRVYSVGRDKVFLPDFLPADGYVETKQELQVRLQQCGWIAEDSHKLMWRRMEDVADPSSLSDG